MRSRESTYRTAVKYGCIVWKGNVYVPRRSRSACSARKQEHTCRAKSGTHVLLRSRSTCATQSRESTNRAAVKYGCIVWK